MKGKRPGRNGRPLTVELPFEDALKAALETPPPPERAEKKKDKAALDRERSSRYDKAKK